MDLLPLLHQIILGVTATVSRETCETLVSWGLQFPFKIQAGVSDWKSFTTGPHDFLAAREAGEPRKGAASTTIHKVGGSWNIKPKIWCYWAAKASDQSLLYIWFTGIIPKCLHRQITWDCSDSKLNDNIPRTPTASEFLNMGPRLPYIYFCLYWEI